MKRRHLVKLAALSLAGLAVTAAGLRPLRAHEIFQDLFGDDGLAAQLGRLHQGRDPAAGARGRSLVAEIGRMRRSARAQQLRQRRQADLAALDVVVADGWVMARSEADLCAAIHLDRNIV